MPFPRRDHRWLVTDNTREELSLLREQGYDPTRYQEEWNALVALPPHRSEEAVAGLIDLHRRMQADPGPRRADWPYDEPSTRGEICAARPDGPRTLPPLADAEALRDRLYGAWLGRVAGCMLGKPIEGWKYEEIKRLGEYIGEWPLAGYIPYIDGAPEEIARCYWDKSCLRQFIQHGVRDDDTDYTIFGTRTLEEYGVGVTTEDLVDIWLHSFPIGYVYTAELIAYTNLVNHIPPPRSAYHLNGYREWIGAQIRADGWAYAVPGQPERAADLAFRDASITHEKNGIYGEMFFAAAISAALVLDDLDAVLRAALAEIPAKSRLAEAVQDTIAIAARHRDWESAWREVAATYNHYYKVHTINNACFVVLGLLFSGMDFERGIAYACMAGEDVDCNGATAGSILGAMLGARALPAKWTAPLRDTLHSCVMGNNVVRLSDMAARSLALARQ